MLRLPLAAALRLMVTVWIWLKSASLMVTVENGVAVPVSLMVVVAVIPPNTGASLTDIETTVVALLVTTGAMPSLTLMVNVVVSVLPTATLSAVGVKMSPLIAACAAAAVPVKL